jgi:hypothetical protein
MKTRFIVSTITAAALALGSVGAFADAGIPSTWRGVAPSEPQPGQTQVNPQWQAQQWQRGQQAQRAQRDQQWQRGREAHRGQDRRERYEHRERNHRNYGWQQPNYVYQQPAYGYEQPGYYYQQPQYYGYDNSGDAGDVVLGAIVGGVIANAIVNSR